jgi:hypothetical protein
MNPKGNPDNLIPSHPGNLSAVKSGAYSPRLMNTRAMEILGELDLPPELDAVGKLAAREAANLTARIEAMDGELDRNGMTNRKGEDRPLVQRRDSLSRRLTESNEQLNEALSRARRDVLASSSSRPGVDPASCVRRLAAIAASPEERAPDRIAADKAIIERYRQLGIAC